MDIIYLDNAATSWPKPEQVILEMNNYMKNIGSNPGRSGHRLSIEAGRKVFNVRELIAKLFNIDDPLHVIFTKNATEALNIVIFGFLKPKDHVITTSMEHNSVIRPLRSLEKEGVEISIIPCSSQGELDPKDIIPEIKKNTKLIIATHASNVTGTLLPIEEIGNIAKEYNLIFCVDSAQTAGVIPIDVKKFKIDLLAFTGHKSLYGPTGTGGLFIDKDIVNKLNPIIIGGTGSKSESEIQPNFIPDKFEAGTLNTVGICGLGAGVNFILSEGIEKIRKKEKELTKEFINGLTSISKVKLFGKEEVSQRTSVVSFNIEGVPPSESSLKFDEIFNIMSRPGLHCAPLAHKTIKTYPEGTNRFSFGYFNTKEDVFIALEAVEKLAKGLI